MAAIERCKEFMTNGTFNMVRKATGHNTTVTPWVGFCGVGAIGRRHILYVHTQKSCTVPLNLLFSNDFWQYFLLLVLSLEQHNIQ